MVDKCRGVFALDLLALLANAGSCFAKLKSGRESTVVHIVVGAVGE